MMFELDGELQLLQHSALRLARERFAAKAAHWDVAAEPPLENLKPLAEAGLAGITIDEAYGGSGASILHAVVAMEQIARVCPVTSAFILANCTAAELIQQFGSEAHKQRYLSALAAGETVGCWAMTEPGAGSDAGEIRTRAAADGDAFVISGSKCFITRAAIAGFFVTFARVGDAAGSKAIAAFVVEKGDPGLRLGRPDRRPVCPAQSFVGQTMSTSRYLISRLLQGIALVVAVIFVYIRDVLVQLETPDAIRGRVSAVNGVFIGASNELGEFESGVVAAWIGTVPAVVVGGVATLLVALVWMRLFPEIWNMKRFPDQA